VYYYRIAGKARPRVVFNILVLSPRLQMMSAVAKPRVRKKSIIPLPAISDGTNQTII
jgi:hypothetical protein